MFDGYTKAILTIIAMLLAAIALRPAVPSVVHAQPERSFLYVEPGSTMLRQPDGSRQVEGKVIIDLKSGDVWGFPTLSKAPYPVDRVNTTPPVSSPIYLGRFDLSKLTPAEGNH